MINDIFIIKTMLLNGEIDYNKAKEMAQPIIKDMNKKAKEIAKKYKVKPKKISFTALMR